MFSKIYHKLNTQISFEVEGFCITLHRGEDKLSHSENAKRLASYVDLICETGKKYISEQAEELKIFA